MTWGEVAGDVWTVPAIRMKGGREHRVPLTAPAVAVLEDMREIQLSDFVFPGDLAGDEPLSDMALTETIRRMNEARVKAGTPPWTDPKQGNRTVVPHGFRVDVSRLSGRGHGLRRLAGRGGAGAHQGR